MATEFPRHGIKTLKSEDIMDAWDRVGTVTSEKITSLMNKEAVTVLSDLCTSPPNKRQEARASLSAEQPSQENWSQALAGRMDRMSRKSMLLMQGGGEKRSEFIVVHNYDSGSLITHPSP